MSEALPQQEFGLNVIALVGALRYQEQRSIAQIHQQLRNRGVEVSERSVTHLLERYDELVALWLSDHSRLKAIAKKQGRLILAIDGMQPDVGHEVLWVIRDCLSGEILLAKTLLVIRGTVQLASAIATALHSFTAQDLSQVCVQTWQQLRSDLCQHQLNRIEQLRFRRNPEAYLATLEQLLL
ncbi:MAG: hypothetical protein HWQ42_21275 [Nostoc sp. JL23]|nr:hypothetical protein [Nostoc sp. JL23]